MRREVVPAGTALTAGELRDALAGVDDGAPVVVGSGYGISLAVGEDLLLSLTVDGDDEW